MSVLSRLVDCEIFVMAEKALLSMGITENQDPDMEFYDVGVELARIAVESDLNGFKKKVLNEIVENLPCGGASTHGFNSAYSCFSSLQEASDCSHCQSDDMHPCLIHG